MYAYIYIQIKLKRKQIINEKQPTTSNTTMATTIKYIEIEKKSNRMERNKNQTRNK